MGHAVRSVTYPVPIKVKVSLDVSKPASLLATLVRKLVAPFDAVAKAKIEH